MGGASSLKLPAFPQKKRKRKRKKKERRKGERERERERVGRKGEVYYFGTAIYVISILCNGYLLSDFRYCNNVKGLRGGHTL